MSRHLVPKAQVRVEMRVSNSRFIATLTRADSVRSAQEFIRTIRADMPDATHHVYAYRIGHDASITEGLSDDGEPSGTAGPPAMAVVRGSSVGDIVLVITRYFGGTKLGTGGLVTAYQAAAKAAIAAMETEEKILRVRRGINVPYELHAPAMRSLHRNGCLVESEEFGPSVSVVFQVARERLESLAEELLNRSSGRIQLEEMDAGSP